MANDGKQQVFDFLSHCDVNRRSALLRVAQRVVPADDAEDALHDGVVQVLSKADSFRQDAEVSTWMFRVVFNAALMRRRKLKRARARTEPQGLAANGGGWALAGGAERVVRQTPEDFLAARNIERVLAGLGEGYREVVERCLIEGQDAGKVAADIGLSPAGVRTRLCRARRLIARVLEREDLVDDADGKSAGAGAPVLAAA